ncbi:MAG: hypothetical protein OEQ47_05845 [Acidimicrobiia bacterium]|nr:hypothetical protein [Acidimicrobiia bacterium]
MDSLLKEVSSSGLPLVCLGYLIFDRFLLCVMPSRYVRTTELPDTHVETLNVLAGGPPDTDIDPDILAELRSWGLVMPATLQLTGTGARYAGAEKRLL